MLVLHMFAFPEKEVTLVLYGFEDLRRSCSDCIKLQNSLTTVEFLLIVAVVTL